MRLILLPVAININSTPDASNSVAIPAANQKYIPRLFTYLGMKLINSKSGNKLGIRANLADLMSPMDSSDLANVMPAKLSASIWIPSLPARAKQSPATMIRQM